MKGRQQQPFFSLQLVGWRFTCFDSFTFGGFIGVGFIRFGSFTSASLLTGNNFIPFGRFIGKAFHQLLHQLGGDAAHGHAAVHESVSDDSVIMEQ